MCDVSIFIYILHEIKSNLVTLDKLVQNLIIDVHWKWYCYWRLAFQATSKRSLSLRHLPVSATVRKVKSRNF